MSTKSEKDALIMQSLRTFGSLISRSRLAGFLGQSFSNKRDYYEVFGYKTTLTYQDLLARYSRQGVAARIVEAPAQALWDRPPQVISNNDEWNRIWNTLAVRNNLWENLYKVDKLCGLGRYATLFVGISGSGKPETSAKALPSGNLRKVLYLQAYSQDSCHIDTIGENPASEDYMLPEKYQMYPFKQDTDGLKTAGVSQGLSSFKAHSSRVLHVAENTMENNIFGYPRLERVYNELEDMLKVSGGTAETYWITSNRGMQVNVDKDMELSAEDAADLTEEIEEYHHELRRIIRTRGVEIKDLGAQIPRPKETFEMLISLISGATGIPRRILTGSEAGQLASDQDRANWADRIESRRKNFAEPVIIFPLIRMLTRAGVLPQPDGLEITIEWPDAFVMSPLEQAQTSAQHARSAVNFARTLSEQPNLVSLEEARDFIGLNKPTPQMDDKADF